MIKGMEGATDMKFLRANFAGVISYFVSPTTTSSISPRCYQALVDLNQFRQTNFAQFAIDQIITEVKKMGVKKKSVCCCLHHLVILYLDSVDVDEVVESEEVCPIRAATWNDKLIQAVMRKDAKGDEEFGKLKLKESVGAYIRDSLFVGMTRTEEFVSAKLPQSFSNERKRKFAIYVGELCTDISNRIGTFVETIGNIYNEERSSYVEGRRKKQGTDGEFDNEEYDNDPDDGSDGDDDSDDDDEEYGNNKEDEEDGANRDANNGNGRGGEDEQEEDPGCNLTKMPRRSARLTPKENRDFPASNLRERGTDIENRDGDCGSKINDFSVQGLIQRTRRKAEEERAERLHAGQGHQTEDQNSFSELIGMVAAETRKKVGRLHIEAPVFYDDDGKSDANIVFHLVVDRELRAHTASVPVLDMIGSEDAVHKLTIECFNLQKLHIRDDRHTQGTRRQKMAAQRGRLEGDPTNTAAVTKTAKAKPKTVVTVAAAVQDTQPITPSPVKGLPLQ